MNQVESIDARLRDLYREFEDLKVVHDGTQTAFARVKGDLTKLHTARATALASVLTISDHAQLRYAERVLGLDLAELCAELNGQVAALALALGDGKYPVKCANGQVVAQAVVQNKTVVTILPA